jgi:hypothetical protein
MSKQSFAIWIALLVASIIGLYIYIPIGITLLLGLTWYSDHMFGPPKKNQKEIPLPPQEPEEPKKPEKSKTETPPKKS